METLKTILPVSQVTLMEDRATVKRNGTIHLTEGKSVLEIDGVSPFLIDKTINFENCSDLHCSQLTVRRRKLYHEEQYKDDSKKLFQEIEALHCSLFSLLDELETHNTSIEDIQLLMGRLFEEIELEVTHGQACLETWSHDLNQLLENTIDLKKCQRQQLRAITALRRDISEKQQLIDNFQQKFTHHASLLIELQAFTTGDFTLNIDYLLACACWRPLHRASYNSQTQMIDFTTCAAVWQNTGEDWQDVQLFFSSERASLGVELPSLKKDVLYTQRKSKEIHLEINEQQIQELSEVHEVQSKLMPGINDGGEVLLLRAPQKSTLTAAPYATTIEIEHFSVEAAAHLLSYPELYAAVVLRTECPNTSSRPLLAGPVELSRDGALIGRTDIDFTSVGEGFTLDWGADSALSVKREIKKSSKNKALSSWRDDNFECHIYLSNLGSESKLFSLTERIPVSDIDKVKIALNSEKTSENKNADSNGFIKWDLKLLPFENKKLELHYQIKKHQGVND